MTQRFQNNSRSTLASQLEVVGTDALLTPGAGDLFPVASVGDAGVNGGGDWFKATITNLTDVTDPPVDVRWEIVYVRTRGAGNSILSNLIRGQEGTIAQVWPAGSVIRIALTAADVEATVAKTWNTVPVIPSGAGRMIGRDDTGGCLKATSGVGIPAGVMEEDDVVSIYNHTAGNMTITPDGGVTLWWDNGKSGPRILTTRGLCTLICVGSNEFRITGSGIK